MHIEMSDFETTNLHCFVAPRSIQIALEGIATSLDKQTTSGRKKKEKRKKYQIINYKEVVTGALFHMFGC